MICRRTRKSWSRVRVTQITGGGATEMGLAPQTPQARENPSRIQEKKESSYGENPQIIIPIPHPSEMDGHHGQGKVRSCNLKEKEQKNNLALLGNVPVFGVKWNWGPWSAPEQIPREIPRGVSECQGPPHTGERTAGR